MISVCKGPEDPAVQLVASCKLFLRERLLETTIPRYFTGVWDVVLFEDEFIKNKVQRRLFIDIKQLNIFKYRL